MANNEEETSACSSGNDELYVADEHRNRQVVSHKVGGSDAGQLLPNPLQLSVSGAVGAEHCPDLHPALPSRFVSLGDSQQASRHPDLHRRGMVDSCVCSCVCSRVCSVCLCSMFMCVCVFVCLCLCVLCVYYKGVSERTLVERIHFLGIPLSL